MSRRLQRGGFGGQVTKRISRDGMHLITMAPDRWDIEDRLERMDEARIPGCARGMKITAPVIARPLPKQHIGSKGPAAVATREAAGRLRLGAPLYPDCHAGWTLAECKAPLAGSQ